MAPKLALVKLDVAMPVPVIDTFAVDVAFDVPGAYCTLIVQLPPGATTVPEVQVPPERIEKIPAPLAVVIVGAADRVRFPVAVAALLTVTKPDFVNRLATVVVSVGNAEKLTFAPVTVNVTAELNCVAPCGVVTVTPRAPPTAAPLVMAKVAVRLVPAAFTLIPLAVTPVPPMVTAVAPDRLTPVIVTPTLVPRRPVAGLIPDTDGPATLKATVFVVPVGVETLTVRAPTEAFAAMVNVAVTFVADVVRML